MGRKAGVLEFRRPKRRHVVVRRKPSKFRAAGRGARPYGHLSVAPLLRVWMAITVLVPLGLLAASGYFSL